MQTLRKAMLSRRNLSGDTLATAPTPYSIQECPEPQSCPNCISAIVLQGSNQGHRNLSKICPRIVHTVLQAAPPRGRQLHFTFPSAPDPLFKASRAPFLTLRVATSLGAPRQAPLDNVLQIPVPLIGTVKSKQDKL